MTSPIDEITKEKKQFTPPIFEKQWTDWNPLWTGKKHTIHDQQEKHSPTETVTIKNPPQKQTLQIQRRIVDARLWKAMSPPQQDASIEIARAFEMMSRGLGYASSNWEHIPGGRGQSNISDNHGIMINNYVTWSKNCAKEKISHSIIIDLLCFNLSCKAVDRERRMKNGSAKKILLSGLSIYCKLRGWDS